MNKVRFTATILCASLAFAACTKTAVLEPAPAPAETPVTGTGSGEELKLNLTVTLADAFGDVKAVGMNPVICEKGYRNRPLTDEQKENNRRKSKVRCRVEHVFGFMEGALGGLVVRSIGLERSKANVALTSLVYNVCRFIQIRRHHSDWMLRSS